jgi:hypothetical protein
MTVFRPGSRARKRTDCGHLRGFKPRSRRRQSALTFAGRWSRGCAVPVVRHRLKLAPTDVGGYPGLFNRRQEVKAKLPSRSCLSKGRNDEGERSQPSVGWTGARTFQSAATLVDLAGQFSPVSHPPRTSSIAADWKVRAPVQRSRFIFFNQRERLGTGAEEGGCPLRPSRSLWI